MVCWIAYSRSQGSCSYFSTRVATPILANSFDEIWMNRLTFLLSVSLLALGSLCSPVVAQDNKLIYGTPANWNDFPDDQAKQARMLALWNWNMAAFAETAITGNPGQEHSTPHGQTM